MQAVILAGGLGSRLAALTGGLPKALVDVAGKPLLFWQLELLARHRFTDVLILVRHGAEAIISAAGDGSAFGVSIDFVVEDDARGTAGAVLAAKQRLQASFAVLYGDTVLNVDLGRMQAAHAEADADATLFVHPNDHPQDSDLVEANEAGNILAFRSKPRPPTTDFPNLVNAALYMIEKRCLNDIASRPGILDFGAHLFPQLLAAGARLQAYRSREYIKDAGTPERLAKVVADVQSGRVANGSLETPAAAIFLDRDGTLNEDPGHISRPEQIALFPDAADAVGRVNRSGYLAVVVTNQPVVARGDVEEAGLQRIHSRMEHLLGGSGAYLDAIYHCPHHPDRGFAGERPELKIACSCRKPATGLVDHAVADMNIDLSASWMIGDTFSDIEMASRARLRSVLLDTGDGGNNSRFARRPDFEFRTLGGAVNFILDDWPRLAERAAEVADSIRPSDLVLIGGLARSGKSSFASALKWQLDRRRTPAKVISLDGWIRAVESRQSTDSVLDRFDLGGIEKLLASLSRPFERLAVPLYNRKLRRPDREQIVEVWDADVVIAEGVIALAHNFPCPRRTVRIFVARDEARRYLDLRADYRARSFTAEEFEALYSERQRDEFPVIIDSRRHADIIVETP